MKTSEQINELAAALSKAQGAFTNPEKNRHVVVKMKAGGEYSFSYATLDSIIEMARPPLAKNGLSVYQTANASYTEDATFVTVTTRIMHESGQFLEDSLSAYAEGGIQQLGSCVSYLRRYSYVSSLCIASEEDDDGNVASGNSVSDVKREPLPECPKCKTNKSVIVGKAEYGGGFLCWKKKDGCGHSWQLNLPPVDGNGHGEPNLSAADAELLSAASTKIHEAQSEEDLDLVVRSVEVLSEPVKAVLRPLFKTRREVIRTGDKTKAPW